MVKSIKVVSTPVVVSMGSKKGRKSWTKSLTIDLSTLPEPILSECLAKGVSDWIRSAGTREIVIRDGDTVIERRQATEEEALRLMAARYEQLQKGNMDRHMNYVDPITRRAMDNLIRAMAAQAAAKGQTLPEEKVVKAQALAHLKTTAGTSWLSDAKAQLEAENAAARQNASDIGSLLANLEALDDSEEEEAEVAVEA